MRTTIFSPFLIAPGISRRREEKGKKFEAEREDENDGVRREDEIRFRSEIRRRGISFRIQSDRGFQGCVRVEELGGCGEHFGSEFLVGE